ncbi:hypothetical protein TNCV_1692561 [Trichonephila clavipes]|nr:hypothetical protein TNCV_1692561 [Trichonephila clavipes]
MGCIALGVEMAELLVVGSGYGGILLGGWVEGGRKIEPGDWRGIFRSPLSAIVKTTSVVSNLIAPADGGWNLSSNDAKLGEEFNCAESTKIKQYFRDLLRHGRCGFSAS